MLKRGFKIVQYSLQNEITRRNASTIGFIGIGNMGSHMAGHLVKKGEKVKVFDISPDAAKTVKGAHVCSSPVEAAQNSDIVFTMLPNGNVVKKTLLEEGVLEAIPKKSLLVDSSTIEPKVSQELFEIANGKDVRFIDAPVSGGVTGAEAGTLAFMVGGNVEDVEYVKPVLLHMGARVFHCGKAGAGQIAKLSNNLILGVCMMGVSEGMNLGIKAGLDPKVLHEIVNVSTGRCWSSETYSPVPGLLPNVPSSNDYKGGFNIRLMSKDLGLAEATAVNSEVSVPLAACAHQIYRALISNGYGDKDFSVIYKFLSGNK
ncbi:probable 3-hydroxyisobutyrate dehydrogenase, mitochondrial [Harmonia axyridis]|uniref:probable 3-hydroxyisobutyrate dehydrogenase, mitochondrial n=1 Tax=Harmonia axyridis TaxID=115357 RepID=UPI001E2763B5|nr:probable 3-hydroxyisobutyrate dehydrogenase, mitochondrial [Harmonia axyridis]